MPETNSLIKSVSVVGLGLLGGAIARRLSRLGWKVTGYDIELKPDQFEFDVVESIEQVCKGARLVLLSLPTSVEVRAVVKHAKGQLARNSIVVDTTTGSPQDAEEISAQLLAEGIGYLDATVAGSSVQAENGDALLLVGGNAEDFSAASSLLDSISSRIHHVGPNGHGARMKLVHNLVLGLNRAVLAEGLALADSLDLDLGTVLQVLRESPAASTVMDTKGRKMVEGDFEPQARLRQHLKDVRVILGLPDKPHGGLPLSKLHEQLLSSLVEAGFGDLDNSAILKAFLSRSQ